MNRAGLTALGCVALALLLAAVPAGTRACGFHSSQTIARTLLNLRYPDALHVDGAVWSAQQKGLLRLDRARLQATGPERRMLDTRAYLEALRALFALGEAFGQTSDAARLPVSLVLTESMLWTRYPADGGVNPHVTGPDPGDLVVVTDDPVLRAIAEGRLTVAEALDSGLVRLFGTSTQVHAFETSYGELGTKPLPRTDQRKLLEAMLWRQRLPNTSACADGDCGPARLDATP